MTIQQLRRSPWRLVDAAATWPLVGQQGARRNALVATTTLMQRRNERLEVEEFLAQHAARRAAPVGPPLARSRTA